MSIYASWPDIGLNEQEEPTGTVLAYLASHRYPHPSDGKAALGLAIIPGHCVPGHEDDDTTAAVGEYLRLDVMEGAGPTSATVILTVAGAEALYHQLGDWLMMPKLTEGSANG